MYIIDSGEGKLEIKKVEASSPEIKLEVKPYTEVKDEIKRWVIKVRLLPQKEEREFIEKIIITTNSEKKPVVEIPVEGKVVGDVAFMPPKAFFGVVKPGEKVKREISIYSRKGNELEIKGYNLNGLPVVAEIETGIKGKTHKLMLELTSPAQVGMVKGYIDIEVESAGEQRLQLPVLALVRE